ncbi:hypothetical protein Trydic_g6641 [Trypoxylus dichotomus]
MVAQCADNVNSIIKLQHFSTQWKTATVIPSKNPPQSSSYHPIFLLSTLPKITERIILEHLNKHLDNNHIISHYQFGFRSEHNTNQKVARLVKDITAGYNNKKHTALVLVELERAFDKVWHRGLVSKLINVRFPAPIIRIVNSYLKNRSFTVKVHASHSSQKIAAAGVPQGSVLGPFLFNIYLADIPTFPHNSIAMDDSALYSASFSPIVAVQKLQYQLPAYEK